MEKDSPWRQVLFLGGWALAVFIGGVLSFQLILNLARRENILPADKATVFNQATVTSTPAPTVISKTVQQIIAEHEELTQFTTILAATTWNTTLANDDGYTVFAPTNDALSGLTAAQKTQLLGTAPNKASQQQFVGQYITKKIIDPGDLLESSTITMVGGRKVTLAVQNSQVVMNTTIPVLNEQRQATNGYVYLVDALLK